MSTFTGNYIKEPSDLRVVCNEADIIAVADDPGGEDARDVVRFADLSANQLAAVVGVMNELIAPIEDEIDAYARDKGYLTPLSPVDPMVVSIAARLVWISMRQRGKALTADAAEDQRRKIRDGQLTDISTGRLILTAAKAGTRAPTALIYAHSTAATRDTTGSTPRLSRKTLEGF